MTHRLVSICSAIVATACFSHAASAVTLYNPALGTPTAQGWFTTSTNAAATSSGVAGGSYRLDTTADPATSAGSFFSGAVLDTAGGVTISFDLQVLSESHVDTSRAGFSFIAVGSSPANAIEVAFWNDRIWTYGPGFSHGTEAMFDTTSAHGYTLTLQNQQFSLSSGGSALLSGSLVDYSSRGIPPYTTPNTLFFGDDTSRAAASVAIGNIVLNPVPEPATAGLFLLGGGALLVRARRAVRSSATK